MSPRQFSVFTDSIMRGVKEEQSHSGQQCICQVQGKDVGLPIAIIMITLVVGPNRGLWLAFV